MICCDTLWGLCRQQSFEELPSTELRVVAAFESALASGHCQPCVWQSWDLPGDARTRDSHLMRMDDNRLFMPCLSMSILMLHRECQCPWNKTILIPQASKSWSSKAHCFSMSCLDWAKTWKDFTERKRKLKYLKYILKWLENILKSCIFVSGPDNPTEDITQMTQQGCRTLRATTCRYVPPVQVSWRKLTGFVFLTFRISNARFLAWVHRSAAFGPGDLTSDSPKNTTLFLVGKESLGASICI